MNRIEDVTNYITECDEEVGKALQLELGRQRRNLELIASENIVSPAVMLAMGTVPTNKYAEGYPGKRYYGGCEDVDILENLAIERAKKLFGCDHVCVQPHSGANANTAVYQALIKPGDTVMGLNLAHGGHLTHGSPVNLSGILYNFVPYNVNDDGVLDYDAIRKLARECKPKMIVAGASAYPREIRFDIFADIAKEVGAYLFVDMAHIAGLVAAGLHQSPVPYADVVTTTTHKTLRGPRGGMIMCKEEYAKARGTVIENAEEAVFEEKKIEEQEVVFLMDRFGYARIVDVAVYERNKEAADSENKYIVHCMNTGKICIFTNSGKMHQVKVIDLPYGKFRDKGVPIDNVSNYSSSDEQIVSVYDSEQMRFAMLLFSTAQGMVKKVSGSEFQVAKRTILATKLQEEDSLVDVRVVNENKHVVLQTKNGYFLRFPATEVPIKKKAAVGVRGIRLQKKDELEKVYLFEEGTETKILYNEKEVSLNRLKTAKRDGAGTKARK